MIGQTKAYESAPTWTLTQVDSAVASIHSIKSAMADAYEQRVQMQSSGLDRCLMAYPKSAALVGAAACAAGVAGAMWLANFAVDHDLGVWTLFICLGCFLGGVVGVVAGIGALTELPKEGQRVRERIMAAPLNQHELKSALRQLYQMSPEERESVRDYILGVTDKSASKFGPVAKQELREIADAAAADTESARIGAAAAIVASAPECDKFSTFQKRVGDLLKRTPPAERADLADALRRRLFNGDRCLVAKAESKQQQALFALLTSYNVVTTTIQAA